MKLDLAPRYEEAVKKIFLRHLPHAKVWAFGSRVSGSAVETSDLDLVIVADEKTNFKALSLLQVDFEESDIPFKVDVLDWQRLSADFQKVIKNQYIVFIS